MAEIPSTPEGAEKWTREPESKTGGIMGFFRHRHESKPKDDLGVLQDYWRQGYTDAMNGVEEPRELWFKHDPKAEAMHSGRFAAKEVLNEEAPFAKKKMGIVVTAM